MVDNLDKQTEDREVGEPPRNADRLDSWSEIAAYLDRRVRTVQRWEQHEGLPVHRHQHRARATVYAFRSEIDAWLEARQPPARPREAAAQRAKWLVLSAVLLIAVFWFASRRISDTPIVEESAQELGPLIVLPVANASDDPALDAVCEALTDEVNHQLAILDTDRLAVLSRTSALSFAGSGLTIRQIAEASGSGLALESSLRREKEGLRAIFQLIDVSSDSHRMSIAAVATPDDDAPFVRTLALAAAKAVAEELGIPVPGYAQPPISTDAFDAFARGRRLFDTQQAANLELAKVEFERAAELQPDWAEPLAWKAMTLVSGSGGLADPEQIRESARRALELDPHSPLPNVALALAAYYHDFDWNEAYRRFELAEPSARNFPLYYVSRATFSSAMARHEEAVELAEHAFGLDPKSSLVAAYLGMVYNNARLWEEADWAFSQASGLSTEAPELVFQLWSFENRGNLEAAVAWREANGWEQEARVLGDAFRDEGPVGYWRAYLELLEDPFRAPNARRAVAFTQLGDFDTAFTILEGALENRNPTISFLDAYPLLEPLRADPRYDELRDRLELPWSPPD